MIVLLFFAASFAGKQYGNGHYQFGQKYGNYSQSNNYLRKRNQQIQQCRKICKEDYEDGQIQVNAAYEAEVNAGANDDAPGKKTKEKALEDVLKTYNKCKEECTKFLKNLKDGVVTKLGDKAEDLVDVQIDGALESLFELVGAGISKASGVVKYLSTGTEDFKNKAKPHAVVLKNQVDITIEYKGFEAKHGKQFGLKNFSKKDSLTEETINNGETLAVRFANNSWSPAGVSGTAIFHYYDDKDINKMLFVDIEHITGDGSKCCAYTSDYVSQWREEASQKRKCANDQRKWIENAGSNLEILKDNKTSEFSSQAGGSTDCKPGAGCKRIRYCTINFFKTEHTAAGSVKITIPDKEVTEFFINGNVIEDTNKQAPDQKQRNYFQQQSSYKQRNPYHVKDYDESEDDYDQADFAQFFKNPPQRGSPYW